MLFNNNSLKQKEKKKKLEKKKKKNLSPPPFIPTPLTHPPTFRFLHLSRCIHFVSYHDRFKLSLFPFPLSFENNFSLLDHTHTHIYNTKKPPPPIFFDIYNISQQPSNHTFYNLLLKYSLSNFSFFFFL